MFKHFADPDKCDMQVCDVCHGLQFRLVPPQCNLVYAFMPNIRMANDPAYCFGVNHFSILYNLAHQVPAIMAVGPVGLMTCMMSTKSPARDQAAYTSSSHLELVQP